MSVGATAVEAMQTILWHHSEDDSGGWGNQHVAICFHNPYPISPASSNQPTPSANVRCCQRASEVKSSGHGLSDTGEVRFLQRMLAVQQTSCFFSVSFSGICTVCVFRKVIIFLNSSTMSSACFQPILLCFSRNPDCPISGSSQLSAHPTISQRIKKHKCISIAQNQRERSSLLCLYNRKRQQQWNVTGVRHRLKKPRPRSAQRSSGEEI